ncbi:uncharacterized protein K452DRAFT_245860 [Aplosporella prunicola CBS 121167]|uniref:Uncharacterized protein n=1 Tax=Aplosporella prunicola CBS 121167 TaxID=1176127 RepID=A0A6A6BND9_9PEZI|nr:uncharacterized protein K452DRAFT_245860 [Aplosporella prunicola CBS 121167]KAF2144754.1 hypothetical protein K452DRAFT_245860 [Aplosporella prunicola CBS 121167]
MTTYELADAEFAVLKRKVVLVTGGASGIGKEAVRLAHHHGARVAFGDVNEAAGNALAAELKDRVLFRKCDVTQWDSVLELFETTVNTFGKIHAVLSNAGINKEDFLAKEFDAVTGKLLPPDLGLLDANLVGMVYVVKCAVYCFEKWPQSRCQIVLTGSAASYLDTPPLHLYCASKAGVLGLMRSLRSQLVKRNVTVNVVAPWMTVTPLLLQSMHDIWGDLPANQPEGVARALLLPVVRPDLNGKTFFVAGHRIVELEDKLHETQPLWMGQQLSEDVDEGQRRLCP